MDLVPLICEDDDYPSVATTVLKTPAVEDKFYHLFFRGFAIAYYFGFRQSAAVLIETPELALSCPGVDKVCT